MVSGREPEFPRPGPAAGPSPEGSPAFFGVTMPRRRLQGWRLWGNLADFADLDDPIDFYDFLRIRGIVGDSEDCECELNKFDEFVEHIDNQRW